jgi:hypothetical protein
MDGLERGFDKISLAEIQGILKRHGMFTFDRHVGPLFTRFDKDKDGLVGVGDFKEEITPIDPKVGINQYDYRRFNFLKN